MFTSSLLSNAPQITTRRALIVLDLQNDFVKPDGALFVKNTPKFVPHVADLVSSFRESGEVIWVQTAYETRQPVSSETAGGETIIVDNYDDSPSTTATTSRAKKPRSSLAAPSSSPSSSLNPNSPFSDDPEAFLSLPDSLDKAASSSYPRRCCLPNSTGFQFPAPILSAIDYNKDTVLVKSGYSAFESSGLVLSFRMRFVTEVYICGSLSNVSVHATALDAVRHGLTVTLIEDCLGYRSFARHKEAMGRMADIMGANGITSAELIEEGEQDGGGGEYPPLESEAAPSSLPAGMEEGVEKVSVSWELEPASSEGEEADGEDSAQDPAVFRRVSARIRRSQSPGGSNGNNNSGDRSLQPRRAHRRRRKAADENKNKNKNNRNGNGTKIETNSKETRANENSTALGDSQAKSSPVSSCSTSSQAVHSNAPRLTPESSQPRTHKRLKPKQPDDMGPGDSIGAGDSSIIYDLDLPSNAFELLRDEVNWQKMYHLSGQVPRLVAVQGAVREDGSIPIYRHPADESPPLLPFTKTVDLIRSVVEQQLGHPLNHVLIQLYRDGTDKISEHSDKTLDIVRGSNICNVSLGAQRVMTLRTKADAKTSTLAEEGEEAASAAERQTQKVPMPHNSLFILGETTNMQWLHGIRQDKRPESTKSKEELAFKGERISLTFRHIGTFVNPDSDTIWGQGAVSKDKVNAGKIIHGESTETERMIRAFGQENHRTDFDWNEHYGRGFDVVNFVTTSTAKLVLSGDSIRDLSTRLALTENGVRYQISTLSDLPSGSISISNPETITKKRQPVLLPPDGPPAIVGSFDILSHIGHHMRSHDSPDPAHRVLAADLNARLKMVHDLALLWTNKVDIDAMEAKLSWVESMLNPAFSDGPYISGRNVGVEDCVLWAVVRDMLRAGWPVGDGYPSLAAFYSKLAKRACVKQVLQESAD